jgi:drug/metabolite transporter (DMT)-like permease|tara:strand:- start:760 stop:1650 length:891 start_codon:yes stop_codon:yes gene_type:complete
VSTSLKAAIFLCFASLFWSGNFVIGRFSSLENIVSPLSLAFYRWVIAFLILTPFCLQKAVKELPLLKKQPGMIFLIILTGPTLFNTLVYLGLTATTVINSLLIISTTPMLIILLNKLLYKAQTNIFQMIGIFISLIGVCYVITKGSFQNIFDSEFYFGDLFILLAVTSWALYSIFLKKNETGVSGFSFLYLSFVFTVILLFPVYLYDIFIQDNFINIDQKTLLVIGYTGIFPSIISYMCWNTGVALIGPNKSGPFLHLMPIFGGILAFLVFRETLEIYHYAGILSVIIGIIITNKK